MKLGKKIKGFFFGMKPKSPESRTEEMVQLILKYAPALKKAMQAGNIGEMDSEGRIIGNMYDFYAGFNQGFNDNVNVWEGGVVTVNTNGVVQPNDGRIAKKPVEIQHELETVPTPFTCENLDSKISTLKDKHKLLNQRYAKDQVKGLTQRLENRKHYKDHYKFFEKFPNTTEEKIDVLLKKYKLEFNTSDLFIPVFPTEAIEIMKEYSSVCKKFTDEKPVFYVIAEEKDFKKKRERLDPILLVQSPFGFFWQILGAWDKEILLLNEL